MSCDSTDGRAVKPAPQMPERLTLPALQRYVSRIVSERGFTSDLDRVFILLVEELGELAEEMLAAGMPVEVAREKFGAELADVTMYLADVANGLRVDLASALAERNARLGIQLDAHVLEPERATLTEWQAAEKGPDSAALAELMAAAGTIARCLRKRWAGKPGPEATGALAQGLGAVLALANGQRIDLDAALRAKEVENAQRTWTY
jgi:NTP pyrophosphatase (non-canonical NTP hydrolase)